MPTNEETGKDAASGVPRFASLEEEVEFWDTHSPLDYADYWKEAKKVKARRPLGHILGVRLDAKVIVELSDIARRKGVGPSTLARIWLMERLEQEQQTRKNASGKQATSQATASP